jgi:hypothetical protein
VPRWDVLGIEYLDVRLHVIIHLRKPNMPRPVGSTPACGTASDRTLL